MQLSDEEYQEEKRLLNELEARNVKAFMRLYKEYKDDLLIFAFAQLEDKQKAVETVEEFFEDLWAATRFTEISPPIYKYLLKQLRTLCNRK